MCPSRCVYCKASIACRYRGADADRQSTEGRTYLVQNIPSKLAREVAGVNKSIGRRAVRSLCLLNSGEKGTWKQGGEYKAEQDQLEGAE
jgi:hypothetical protein